MNIYDGNGNIMQILDVDATLTKRGYAADAYAVGKRLEALSGLTKIEPADDDVPTVYFTGTLPTTKAQGKLPLEMMYVSKTASFFSYVTLKVQGDSSAAYPKKNFNMVMYSDPERKTKMKRSMRGWGKNHKYCLKANWIDHTHARNVVNAKLWGQMCASRSDIATYPSAFLASPNYATIDGFPIRVYVNDVYWGLYTWNMTKDEFMFGGDEDNPLNAFAIADDISPGVMFNSATTAGWTEELTDVFSDSITAAWVAMQNFVINSTDAEFKTNIGQYFYLSSLIDRYIFSNVTQYIGGFAKSQAYYTYDGAKWLSGMYDMDTAWALNWDGQSFLATNMACPGGFEGYKNGNHNRLIDRIIALYPAEIKARYAELRAGVLSNENIIQMFQDFTDPMLPYYEQDYASTTGNGAFTNIPSKTTNTPESLISKITARLAYTDSTIPNL